MLMICVTLEIVGPPARRICRSGERERERDACVGSIATSMLCTVSVYLDSDSGCGARDA